MPSFFCMPFFACNRQVDSLDKRQCNLQTIPHEIERYSRTLEELLLDMNHIRELSKSLFRLHKLRRLGLSDNDIHRLPSEVAALQNLVELNISRNDISDLPEDLKNCRSLLFLDVSSNPIARLPDSITQVVSLTQLSLNDTSLTKLPQDIGQLRSLRSLEVRENHLRSLPSSIVQLVNLLRLDLGQNELDVLPAELGALRALQELYADDNSIESLPESIMQCTALEQLDVSSNRLLTLPSELGELVNLVDLTLSHNCLSFLPNSIGRLKRLSILRMNDNSFLQLTPAVGSCTSLNELYLTQNLISELPSTIGNLHNLQNLNADKNQLNSIPALIGECTSLSLLSLRDNLIEELPMEIGKLTSLRVLDVCNNRLNHLPFTINVLFNLQALWLSENQSQALLKLQQDVDPRTGMKVLTCYLLPQQSAAAVANELNNRLPNRSFVGGPKVHFGELDEHSLANVEDVEVGRNLSSGITFGNFERHDTPHPKPSVKGAITINKSQAPRKASIDGHVIPHLDDQQGSSGQTAILLSKKMEKSKDGVSSAGHANNDFSMPKPALKHSTATFHVQQQNKAAVQAQLQQKDEASKTDPTPHFNNKPSITPYSFTVASRPFEGGTTAENFGSKKQLFSATTLNTITRRVVVRREPGHGLGLSIAGGMESNPYKDGDCGLFISKLIPGAPAERAGLYVGDKILEINGSSMLNERHDVAVECIQKLPDVLNLVISRIEKSNTNQGLQPPNMPSNSSPNLISTTCRLNEQGRPNFTIHLQNTSMDEKHFVVFSLFPNSSKDDLFGEGTSAKIKEGDWLLSVNGVNVDEKSLSEALTLLRGAPGAEIYLVLQRPLGYSASKSSLSETSVTEPTTAAPPSSLQANNSGVQQVQQRLVLPNATSLSSLRNVTTPGSSLTNTNERSTQSTASLQPNPLDKTHELTVADLACDDARFDGMFEDVELRRDANNALGLSIVGGVDHCSHPFGTTVPGIFISKIAENSPAAASRRLRIGDRILRVNDCDIERAKHAEAVEALKKAGQLLRIRVRHDAQPRGLRLISFRRRDGASKLGFGICGGINAPVLKSDPTDEGIFIEHVNPQGYAAINAPQLRVGMRILEVNDESLLGSTKSEAAEVLRSATSPIRLLVCDGFSNEGNEDSSLSYSNHFYSPQSREPTPHSSSTSLSRKQLQQSTSRLSMEPQLQPRAITPQKLLTHDDSNQATHFSTTFTSVKKQPSSSALTNPQQNHQKELSTKPHASGPTKKKSPLNAFHLPSSVSNFTNLNNGTSRDLSHDAPPAAFLDMPNTNATITTFSNEVDTNKRMETFKNQQYVNVKNVRPDSKLNGKHIEENNNNEIKFVDEPSEG